MKIRRNQKGMAALEFGLVLPVLMLILFGIVEFGVAFYKQQVLTGAVREGARQGIVASDPRPSATDIETAVRSYLQGVGWDTSQANVIVSGAGGASGDPLTVEAQYPTSLAVLSGFMHFTNAASLDNTGQVLLKAKIVMELE